MVKTVMPFAGLAVIASLVAALAWSAFRQKPTVVAAEIMVLKKNSEGLPKMQNGFIIGDGYPASHMVLIRSQVVAEHAVKKRNLTALPSFKNQDPSAVIVANLKVRMPENNDHILELAYECVNPEEGTIILNAVIESYQDFLDEAYCPVSEKMLQAIMMESNQVRKRLQETQDDYQKFLDGKPAELEKVQQQDEEYRKRITLGTEDLTRLVGRLRDAERVRSTYGFIFEILSKPRAK